SRPGFAVEMARTVMPCATSLAVALASVMVAGVPDASGQIGSWPGASPNQTMMRLLTGRHPITPPGGTARLSSANNWPSGLSPPPLADHALIPAITAATALVGLTWCWKQYGSPERKSL